MADDNQILGSFTMLDIPAAPRGQEKFDLVYDLDVNGILNVSATHHGTGRKQGITVDARTSGRLSTDEIDDLIEKAERRKRKDEKEENRRLSMNKLEALCSEVRQTSGQKTGGQTDYLLRLVQDNLDYLTQNPNFEESHYTVRYNALLAAANTAFEKVIEENSKRSRHVLQMSQMTAKYCLDCGNNLLQSGSEKNLEKALEWFRKAYGVGREKGKIDKMVIANQKIGHTCRKLIEIRKDKRQTPDIYIRAATRLTDAILLGQRNKVLSKDTEETIVKDMKFISVEFFQAVAEMQETDISTVCHFMSVFSMGKDVDIKNWNRIVFDCCIRQIEMFLIKIQKNLQDEDFKSALFIISELTFPKEEAARVLDTDEESEQLFEVKKELDSYANVANGQKNINMAEEIMTDANEVTEGNLDRTFIALDLLHEAKDLTRYEDLKIFCQAKVYEGKLFLEMLLNKTKAKACFKEVVDISLSQGYTNTIWYREANVLYQNLRKEEVAAMEPSKEKPTMTTELESELSQLEAKSSASHEEFLNFVFSTFPPVHIQNWKKPEVNETSKLKKVYVRVSAYYHPDKVDERIHGEKYKVLCGEIAKRVNNRYGRMKMSN